MHSPKRNAVAALWWFVFLLSGHTSAHDKIDHFVVLLMENRPFDQLFGCLAGEGELAPGADGINRSRPLHKDPTNPAAGVVNVTCGTAHYVCHGTGYAPWAPKFKNASDGHKYPYGPQSDVYSYENGARSGDAIEMFAGKQLPVKRSIARNFAIFNRYFSSVPSYSTPNHLFIQAATSCGISSNAGFSQRTCGPGSGRNKTGALFPMKTIFDSMAETHGEQSFAFYINDTNPRGNETKNDTLAVYAPDTMMAGVARYRERYLGYKDLFEQAAAGTLPKLSWVLPTWDNCDHPCHDVAKGERLLKDIYESIRSGPGWNRTLFWVGYDDTGGEYAYFGPVFNSDCHFKNVVHVGLSGAGMYDHVVPPHEGVPNDEADCHIQAGCPVPFDFRRLGMRAAAMLISPWLPKNTLIQTPSGPTATSQFEHSSIPATAKKLFDLPQFLTKRDAWAGSFDELLTLTAPRTDAPLHLPDAPPPHHGPCIAPCPPPALDPLEAAGRRQTQATQERNAQHCSATTGQCAGLNAVTNKQRHMIDVYSILTLSPSPDVNSMDFEAASRWIGARQREWNAQGGPLRNE